MPATRVLSADGGEGLAVSLRLALPNLLFGLLVVYNTVRLFRHAMWRDELQTFMVTRASNTLPDLYAKLGYEGHPGLWHLLVWVVTRFTGDPVAMQVLHLLIALGIWVLIWRLSPFRPIEKLLLLASYFLFWEYFIVSRNYALAVLLGFGFIALRASRPEQRFWPWVLLGLLANTTVFGAIWALGLGFFFLLQDRRDWRSMLPGVAVFAALLAVALDTMVPAPDFRFASPTPHFTFGFDKSLRFVVGGFIPLFPPFVSETLSWFGGWAAKLAARPFGHDPTQQIFLLLGGAESFSWLALGALLFPVLACLAIVRDWKLTAQYAVIYSGIILFPQLWSYLGAPRHYGFVFIVLVGTVWMWRSRMLPARPVGWLWLVLLAINVIGGLTTLSASSYPYSQSRNAALWLTRHHLESAFLIGVRDVTTSPVAGYLGREIYYPQCQCFGSYIEFSTRRKTTLTAEEVVDGVRRAMQKEGKDKAILIMSLPYPLDQQTLDPKLVFRPIKRFPRAIVADEAYVIYAVRMKEEPGQ